MNKEKQILNTVLYMVCTYYGVDPDDVKGKNRERHLVIARQTTKLKFYLL